MLPDVALHANGYRTLTKHRIKIMVRLDDLRKQRNVTEYSGDLIPETAVAESNIGFFPSHLQPVVALSSL